MKKIIKNVFTFSYLWKAILTIFCTVFLVWLTKENFTRAFYMVIFGLWTLAILYVEETKTDDEPDFTDF